MNFEFKFQRIFWKEISFLKCVSNECNQVSETYCQECIKTKHSYIKVLALVWKIVYNKFNPKLNELFSYSGW
jgi:hypothetical protein